MSADTIVPNFTNPQSLNRYSYVFNNPVNYIDPSGHDPLDDEWQSAFEEAHGREPTWEDRLIRLFSIAFPDEWDWNVFYDDNGNYRVGMLESVLRDDRPASRDWTTMEDALEQLSQYYEWGEAEEFAHDIGTLFAGLPDRFDASMNLAVTGCEVGLLCEDAIQIPSNVWVYLNPTGMPTDLLGGDEDSNVHHWAWGVTLGYHLGGTLGLGANTIREIGVTPEGGV